MSQNQIPLPRIISTPVPPAAILRAVTEELRKVYDGALAEPVPHTLKALVDQMEGM